MSANAPDRSKLVLGGIAGAALLGAGLVFALGRGEREEPLNVATHTETVTSQAIAPSQTASETPLAEPEPEESESSPHDEIVRELVSGSWIIVFKSLEQDRFSETEAIKEAENYPGSVVVDSSSVPGLRSGYWAVSSVDYPSQQAARDACASFGLELGGACYERQIG